MRHKTVVGTLVVAPIRRRRLVGIVTRISTRLPEGVTEDRLKPVLSIPLASPVFPSEILQFYQWCAAYYRMPLGAILKAALPLPRRVLRGEEVVLTEEGIKRLGAGAEARNSLAHTVWQEGKMGGNVAAFLPREGMWEAFLEWTKAGWVQWRYPAFETLFESKVLYYRVTSDLSDSLKLGPKQRDIVGFLLKEGLVEEDVLFSIFPRSRASVKSLVEKGVLLEVYKLGRMPSTPVYTPEERVFSPQLSHEQRISMTAIEKELMSDSPSPILLHGVTGGGKTELYIQAIQRTIQKGESALVMVPEIVLTPQLLSRVRSRCGVPVVVWHSRLTEKERWRQWVLLFRRAPVVVVGARSSIFLPLKRLGLLIVDEEHDPSFKQEEGLLYNARDMAVVRGRLQSCLTLLGSATPSVESYYNVKKGKFRYSVITRRPTGQPLPKVEIVDMRKKGVTRSQTTSGLMLTQPLRAALLEVYAKRQQAFLFLNRRGYARTLVCAVCGEALMCPHCSVSLILHKPNDLLRCHYCGYQQKRPERCGVCGGTLLQMGGGTQRLEEEIRGVVPDARVARLDRDAIRRRARYEALLSRLRNREIDVLVGTQMIVKGHDFPGVALMGVVMADHSLRFPDFRASERTFQLLTQASGRCGRGVVPGRVIIQTFSPGHYSIRYAEHHDFVGFYEEEIRYRRELAYPPFTRLAAIRITGPDLEAVERRATEIAREGESMIRIRKARIQILGAAPALLSRLKNRYRWQVILKGRESKELHMVIGSIFSKKSLVQGKKLTVRVEFDPVQLA